MKEFFCVSDFLLFICGARWFFIYDSTFQTFIFGLGIRAGNVAKILSHGEEIVSAFDSNLGASNGNLGMPSGQNDICGGPFTTNDDDLLECYWVES